MKLVDWNKIKISYDKQVSGTITEPIYNIKVEAPTVEAIPVEWIKKWIEDNPANHQVICMLDAYRNPKMDWRNENEITELG